MTQVDGQRAAFACDYFRKDIVYRTNKRGKTEFGVVVENCEDDSIYDEYEHLSDREKRKKYKRLKLGLTEIAWYPKGNTEAVPQKKVKLYDRSLLPGDVVRRIDDTTGKQRGYCKQTEATLTLKIHGLNKVVENVPASEFVTLSPFLLGEFCLYKSWIGEIKDMQHTVTVSCKDGSRLITLADDLLDFEDEGDERDELSELEKYLYYVGQTLTGPKRCLKKADWIHMTPEMKEYMASKKKLHRLITVTVTELTVASITVKWLCRISDDPSSCNPAAFVDSSPPTSKADKVEHSPSDKTGKAAVDAKLVSEKMPRDILTGQEIALLKKLNYLQNCDLQVADDGYYRIKSSDSIMGFTKWTCKVTEDMNNGILGEKSNCQYYANCVKNGSSGDRKLQNHANRHKKGAKKKVFLCVKKVTEKGLKPAKRRISSLPVECNGRVPVEIVTIKTMVTVTWESGQTECNIPSSSLYPIHNLDNHSFFPGEFVAENKDSLSVHEYGVVQRADHTTRIATIKWFTMLGSNGEPFAPQLLKTEDVSFYDVTSHPDFRYHLGTNFRVVRVPLRESSDLRDPAGRAGQVIDVRPEDGQLLCFWANGSKSYVFPHELHIIDEYDCDDLDSGDDSDFETISCESSGSSCLTDSEDSIKAHIRLKNGIAQRIQLDSSDPFPNVFHELLSKMFERTPTTSAEEELVAPVDLPKNVVRENKTNQKKVSKNNVDNIKESVACSFKLVTSVHDSHTFQRSIFQPRDLNAFAKHISKEIHLLRSSLPPTIVVKAYEDRMDLLSVMIHGPASTPYEDGLFFFDLQLPSDYPKSPPSVHYRSFCTDRLNPNLYEDGKVCISLLGTWSGQGTELWKPGISNLLQLLISIQGLILVAEPYYNEPGNLARKRTVVGQENSRLYNEMVLFKLVQSMTKLVAHPCDAFTEEIRDHCKSCAKRFINRLEKWIDVSNNWTVVNKKSDYVTPGFPFLPASAGICLSLKKALATFEQTLQHANILCE